MKKLALVSILISTVFVVGCQSSGKLVESSQSPFCTSCKSETVTTLVIGLNHEKFKCPKCETSRVYGEYGQEVIHTCTKCGKALEQCLICKKQED